MAMETSGLSSRLGVEQAAPVSSATVAQGHSSPAEQEDKPRRRPPSEDSAKPAAEQDQEEDEVEVEDKAEDEIKNLDQDKNRDRGKEKESDDNDGGQSDRPEHRIDSLA